MRQEAARSLVEVEALHGAVAPGGTLVLAGLLDTQASAVTRAYVEQNMRLVSTGFGEWPVLTLVARTSWR